MALFYRLGRCRLCLGGYGVTNGSAGADRHNVVVSQRYAVWFRDVLVMGDTLFNGATMPFDGLGTMLVFLDVETTGLADTDRICALGAIARTDTTVSVCNELIHPQQKIRPDAMMIHHITNEAVTEKPFFRASFAWTWLQERNQKRHIMVVHNSRFEMEMLQKEGFVWQGDVIDTLKCVRHLIPECEQFSLQFLRYELQLYKHESALAESLGVAIRPHSALSDALHVAMLYTYLKDLADDATLLTLSNTPALIQKFHFGKYKGRYIEEIAMHDRGYLEWLLQQLDTNDEDLHYSIGYYLSLL